MNLLQEILDYHLVPYNKKIEELEAMIRQLQEALKNTKIELEALKKQKDE